MTKKQPVQLEPVQINNEEAELVETFNEVQQQIESLLDEERRLQQELLQQGFETTSVLKKYAAVFNQTQPTELTDVQVKQYVQEQKTQLAMMLYEGIVVREESRKKSVEAIVNNCNGLFTAEELNTKPTSELNKLVQLIKVAVPQQQSASSWTGAGFVDGIMSVQNSREPGSGQGVLEMPVLFGKRNESF